MVQYRRKTYLQGVFTPDFPEKYRGNPNGIVFRSSWELRLFQWCDYNQNVLWWSSEENPILYRSALDGKLHRYFPDVLIGFPNNRVYLVEIKPDAQTRPPKKRNTKKYLQEAATYITNRCKWEAASEWAKDRNYEFVIWTEHTLKRLGVKINIRDGND